MPRIQSEWKTDTSGGSDARVKIWNVKSGEEVAVCDGHLNAVKNLASSGWQSPCVVRVSDSEDLGRDDGARITSIKLPRDLVPDIPKELRRLEFSTDSKLVLATFSDGTTLTGDASSGVIVSQEESVEATDAVKLPSGRWFVDAVGREIRVVDRDRLKSPDLVSFRESKAASDAQWHTLSTSFADARQDAFAAAFHRRSALKYDPNASILNPMNAILAARELSAAGKSDEAHLCVSRRRSSFSPRGSVVTH